MTSCITKALLQGSCLPRSTALHFFCRIMDNMDIHGEPLLLQQFKQALSQRVCLRWTDSSIHQDDTTHRSDQEFSFPLFSMSSALLTPSEHQRLLFVWEILYSQYFFKPTLTLHKQSICQTVIQLGNPSPWNYNSDHLIFWCNTVVQMCC